MEEKTERMQILEMINSGRISVEQGLALLRTVGEADVQPPGDRAMDSSEGRPVWDDLSLLSPEVNAPSPVTADLLSEPLPAPDLFRWRRWWALPLLVGAGLMLWGGLFMSLAYGARGGFNGWVLCASVPVGLGFLVMALAWMSRTAPWLHLRVQQKPGEKPERIALSFPLPIGPVRWLMRMFDWHMPNIQGMPLEDMLEMIERSATSESPLYIHVDDDKDGEKVEIYIG